MEFEKRKEELEDLIEEGIVSYDPDCIRKKSNWGKSDNAFKFDTRRFSREELLKSIPEQSPKLAVMLKKIENLDKKDMQTHGKLFKHFIFSDIKNGVYGAKLLASALIARGMTLGYSAPYIGNDDDTDDDNSDSDIEGGASKRKKKGKSYGKIKMLSENELMKNKQNNFYLLSSVSVYEQGISVAMKKEILSNFNRRPNNIYGDLARIIVMDSGFKEGIDLFDIKYIHLFEPSTVMADQKQTIGRGTRTCGQKGLEFHPTKGWPLCVFIYDMSIPDNFILFFWSTGICKFLFCI